LASVSSTAARGDEVATYSAARERGCHATPAVPSASPFGCGCAALWIRLRILGYRASLLESLKSPKICGQGRALERENQALRRELAELKAMVRSLAAKSSLQKSERAP